MCVVFLIDPFGNGTNSDFAAWITANFASKGYEEGQGIWYLDVFLRLLVAWADFNQGSPVSRVKAEPNSTGPLTTVRLNCWRF